MTECTFKPVIFTRNSSKGDLTSSNLGGTLSDDFNKLPSFFGGSNVSFTKREAPQRPISRQQQPR